jgi:hypothetical protein
MFKFLKKKKPKERKKVVNSAVAIQKHTTRIGNLNEELEICESNLKLLYLDDEIPSSVVNKEANIIIIRMTFIKYELGIREDLIKWL